MVNSDAQITAIVPAGGSTGPIAVTSPSGTVASVGSFAVAPLSITMTSPTADTRWPAGTTQELGFTVSSAVEVGAFNGWLIDTVTGAWYGAGFSVPVAGHTTYAQSFSTVGVPEGTYTAVVYHRPDAGVWGNWQAMASSPHGAVTVP